uniref:Uncharacterized protein n=1 Tax=Salix viminalis TaxID=40686 RepID=A0A6N2M1L3_SALVM
MAPSKLILSLFILLSFLSLSCSARPCKTLFISSYSLSIKPLDPHPNPSNPSSGFLIVTEIEETSTSTLQSNFFNRRFIPKANYEKPHEIYDKKGFQETAQVGSVWHGFGSYDLSSLRDRTKDILSVVVALLFGVGCGALTAATIKLGM